MATKRTTSKKVEPKTLYCKNGCSDKAKALGNFYKSNLAEYEVYGGYCPTCKVCLRKSTIDTNLNMVTMDSIKDALKKVDRPFVEEVFNMIKDRNTTNEKFLGEYLSQLNLGKYKECTYADTLDIQIEKEKIMNSKVEEVKKNDVTQDMINFWGHGKKNEDYMELQTMYDRFMENEEDGLIDYKKQSDYKTLCELELLKRAMILNGEKVGDLAKIVDMISKLSADLNIKAIQKKEDNSNRGAYDLFIKKIEQTKPVFDFERDLGNRDEVKEVLELWFYAYLMDVNNLKTKHTARLHEEIGKYTPTEDEFADGDA